MNAKMKGVFKGLRYISSIFDHEEKKSDIQIGFPTDVKHVSHIGFDGPTADSSPSWMKEFQSSEEVSQSASLNVGHTRENPPEILWVSEDSQRKSKNSSREHPELPKSTRRHHSNKDLLENTSSSSTISPRKEKSRNSRRRSGKDLSENSNSNRKLQVQDNVTSESESSPPRNLPEPPKHYRRKKSKESIRLESGSGRSSRSKGKRSTAEHVEYNNNEESSIRSVITNNVSSVRSQRKACTQVS